MKVWLASTRPNAEYHPELDRALAYRPFDNRRFYNDPSLVKRYGPELQDAWRNNNLCLYTLPSGIGAGPSAWCHANLPDYHSFRGSYGGYAFLLADRRPLSPPHNLQDKLLTGLSAHYGHEVVPEDVLDIMLCLLSASSYSALFAEDLEDSFPHIPYPANEAIFTQGVAVGTRIRTLETFVRLPNESFLTAKVASAPHGPMAIPREGWKNGGFALCADGSGRIEGVPYEVWDYAVSGYEVLPRWLKHRVGRAADYGTVTSVLDLCGRIAELLGLMAEADLVLTAALDAPITKDDLGI